MNCGSHHGQCGCGLTYEQALTYFENYVANALLCGKLQGGLQACDSDTVLPAGTPVVTCAQLQDKINELIEKGAINIPGIESLEFDGERLTLVDQAGTTFQVNLTGLMDKAVESLQMLADGTLTLTLKDGTIFKIPLQEYLADLVKDASIKSGVLDQDGNLVLSLGNGETVTVDMGALKKVYVDRDGPITGDGTKEHPLDVDFSRVCWQVIESMHFTDEGLVIQIANQCDPVVLPLDEILAVLNNKVKVCVDTDQGIITGNGSEGSCLSLDLTKLVGLLINNQTLINNIAQALNYKVKVAVTQGVTGDGTQTNPLNVKLSSDSGNLLTLRDNGLYYGTTAAADVTNLYVDPVAGSDSNPGTRVLPLKSMQAAINKVRSDQSNTIHLRAGQEFYFTGLEATGGATRTILPYGDPYWDGDKFPSDYPSPEVPHFYPEVLANLQRPTIRPWCAYQTSNHVISISAMNPINGGQVLILGCNLNAKPINDVDTGHSSIPADYSSDWPRYNTGMIYGNAAGVVVLRGCTFEVPVAPQNSYDYARKSADTPDNEVTWWTVMDSDAQGNVAAINLNHCNWPEGGNVRLMGMAAASGRLYNTTWPSNPATINNRAGYEMLGSNMGTRLLETKAISGIVRDSDGKPRNILTNFVL